MNTASTLHIQIEKAEITPGRPAPADLVISIHQTDCLDSMSIGEAMQVFKEDAEQLCEALYNALPGGTFGQLLALMLQKRASQLIVSFGDLEVR